MQQTEACCQACHLCGQQWIKLIHIWKMNKIHHGLTGYERPVLAKAKVCELWEQEARELKTSPTCSGLPFPSRASCNSFAKALFIQLISCQNKLPSKTSNDLISVRMQRGLTEAKLSAKPFLKSKSFSKALGLWGSFRKKKSTPFS
jgi:hypothetical protein